LRSFSFVFLFCAPEWSGNTTTKMDNATIGGSIRGRRNNLGLSQEDLAEILFTSKQMISVNEKNRTELKVKHFHPFEGLAPYTLLYFLFPIHMQVVTEALRNDLFPSMSIPLLAEPFDNPLF